MIVPLAGIDLVDSAKNIELAPIEWRAPRHPPAVGDTGGRCWSATIVPPPLDDSGPDKQHGNDKPPQQPAVHDAAS
jgi:hypothetical protein